MDLDLTAYNPEAARYTQSTSHVVYAFVNDLLNKIQFDGNILDHGAGRGRSLDILQPWNDKIRLYEPYPSQNLLDKIDYDPRNLMPIYLFDLIISSYVLNVIPPRNRFKVLQKIIHTHLARSGFMIIAVRSRSDVMSYMKKSNYCQTVQEESCAYVSSKGTYQHGFGFDDFYDLIIDAAQTPLKTYEKGLGKHLGKNMRVINANKVKIGSDILSKSNNIVVIAAWEESAIWQKIKNIQ